MYVKVEPTGCCEHRGKVQVRFCLYLEPGDYGYEKHHVKGNDNPFHNHFAYFDPAATDEEILFVGEIALQVAFEQWEKDERPVVVNQPIEFHALSAIGKTVAETRVEQIKTANLEKRASWLP